MARYIVPAEMPKSCAHCQFSFWVKGRTSKKEYRCALTGLSVCLELNDFETKADWCPLVDAADVVPKSEVEKIFEEIDNWFELYSEREYSFAEEETSKGHLPEAEAHDYALDIIKDLRQLCVSEIEKKYTEEKT